MPSFASYLAVAIAAVGASAYPHEERSTYPLSAFNYTYGANDTAVGVAARFNRGVCNIARLNRFSNPTMVVTNDTVTIPAYNATDIDNTSCLLTNSTVGYNNCLFGGPHTFLSEAGDTIRYIANFKFNMTVESLVAEGDLSPSNDYGVDDVLPTSTETKIPTCEDTSCKIRPYELDYGTVVDLARELNVQYGQIMTLNTDFTYSSYAEHGANGPNLVVSYDCTTLAGYNDTALD